MEEGGKREKDEEGEKKEEDEEEDMNGFYWFYYLTQTQSQSFPKHPSFSYPCTNFFTSFLFPHVCIFMITPHTALFVSLWTAQSPRLLHPHPRPRPNLSHRSLSLSLFLSHHRLQFFHYLDPLTRMTFLDRFVLALIRDSHLPCGFNLSPSIPYSHDKTCRWH